MGIKGDDVLDAYVAQLLQGKGAVQALTADAAMLAAAVQAGHNDADAVGAACNGLDQTHQVLEMVVGREVVLIAEQLIGNAVVARIDENIQVIATGRSFDQALCIAGLETRAIRLDNEGVNIHANLARPAHQVTIYQLAQLFSAGAGNQTQVSDCRLRGEEIARANILFSHTCVLLTSITNFYRTSAAGIPPHLLVLYHSPSIKSAPPCVFLPFFRIFRALHMRSSL